MFQPLRISHRPYRPARIPSGPLPRLPRNTASPHTHCAIVPFGPLETYKERQAALKQERQRSALRSDPALAAASFLAEVANLSPKLSQAEWEAQVQRLAKEFGVDPAAHRSAISRVRRRY